MADPSKEWVDRIGAMKLFDGGWNALQATILENQKKLGIIPEDTTLEPWPTGILPDWDTLSDEERKL